MKFVPQFGNIYDPLLCQNLRETLVKIEDDFRRLWNFPNCIAIDGKHVNIRASRNSRSLYYNYIKFFRTVLLAITNAKYKFIVVDIGAFGRNNDSGILCSRHINVDNYYNIICLIYRLPY